MKDLQLVELLIMLRRLSEENSCLIGETDRKVQGSRTVPLPLSLIFYARFTSPNFKSLNALSRRKLDRAEGGSWYQYERSSPPLAQSDTRFLGRCVQPYPSHM